MADEFSSNDSEVMDVLFGDDIDIKDEDLGIEPEEEEQQLEPVQPPAEQPTQQPAVNESAELQYYKEKNQILMSQLEEVGLNPEMTDSERIAKLAAGGVESEFAKELIDTFCGTMSEHGAKALVSQLVENARSERPDVQRDGENDVVYALRTDKGLAQLNEWFSSGGPMFDKAKKIDEQLSADPKYANVPLTERFKAVQQMVLNGQSQPAVQAQQQQFADPDNFDSMSDDDVELQLEKYADFL